MAEPRDDKERLELYRKLLTDPATRTATAKLSYKQWESKLLNDDNVLTRVADYATKKNWALSPEEFLYKYTPEKVSRAERNQIVPPTPKPQQVSPVEPLPHIEAKGDFPKLNAFNQYGQRELFLKEIQKTPEDQIKEAEEKNYALYPYANEDINTQIEKLGVEEVLKNIPLKEKDPRRQKPASIASPVKMEETETVPPIGIAAPKAITEPAPSVTDIGREMAFKPPVEKVKQPVNLEPQGFFEGLGTQFQRGIAQGKAIQSVNMGQLRDAAQGKNLGAIPYEQIAEANRAVKDFGQTQTDIDLAKKEGWIKDAWDVVKALPGVTIESLASLGRSGLEEALVGAGFGAAAGSVVPGLGTAAGAGLGGAAGMVQGGRNMEYFGTLMQELEANGVDITDARSLREGLAKYGKKADKTAITRANTIAAVESALPIVGEVAGTVAGRVGSKVLQKPLQVTSKALTYEPIAAPLGGASGELAAQVASGQPISLQDIALEAGGEGAATVAAVAKAIKGEKKSANKVADKIEKRNNLNKAMESAIQANPEAEGQIRERYRKLNDALELTDDEVLSAYDGIAQLPDSKEKDAIRERLEQYMAEKGIQPQAEAVPAEEVQGTGRRVTVDSLEEVPAEFRDKVMEIQTGPLAAFGVGKKQYSYVVPAETIDITPQAEEVVTEETPSETIPAEEVSVEPVTQEEEDEDLLALQEQLRGLVPQEGAETETAQVAPAEEEVVAAEEVAPAETAPTTPTEEVVTAEETVTPAAPAEEVVSVAPAAPPAPKAKKAAPAPKQEKKEEAPKEEKPKPIVFGKQLEEKYGVRVDLLGRLDKGDLTLSRIEVPKSQREKGIGTKVMEEIIKYADENGKRLVLSPTKEFGATSVDRLRNFYKGFGFVENKGSNKDFTIKELMYRLPVKAEPTLATPAPKQRNVKEMTLEELQAESKSFDEKVKAERERLKKVSPGRQVIGSADFDYLSEEDGNRATEVNSEIGRRTNVSQEEAKRRVAEKREQRRKEQEAPAAPETKPEGKAATPEIGSKATLPPQMKGGQPRTMVYTKEGWKQLVGGEEVFVGEGVQKQAQEAFEGKPAEAKPTTETKAETKEGKVMPTSKPQETAVEIAKAFTDRFGIKVNLIDSKGLQDLLSASENAKEFFFKVLDKIDVFETDNIQEAKTFITTVFQTVESAEDAKKAYRKLAIKYHPDKRGSEEVMKHLNDVNEKYQKGTLGRGTAQQAQPSQASKEQRYKEWAERMSRQYEADARAYAQSSQMGDEQRAREAAKTQAEKQASEARGKTTQATQKETKAEQPKPQPTQPTSKIKKGIIESLVEFFTKPFGAEKTTKGEILTFESRSKYKQDAWNKRNNLKEENRKNELNKINENLKNYTNDRITTKQYRENEAAIRSEYANKNKAVDEWYNNTVAAIDKAYEKKMPFAYKQYVGNKVAGLYDPKSLQAYVVLDNIDETTYIHEAFAHPFIEAVRERNNELYNNLLTESKSTQEIVDYVDENYGNAPQQVKDAEYIARAIDLDAKGKLKNKPLIQYVKEFWDEANKIFKDIFGGKGVSIENITPTTKVSDIVDFVLKSGEKLDLTTTTKAETKPSLASQVESKNAIQQAKSRAEESKDAQNHSADLSGEAYELDNGTGLIQGFNLMGKPVYSGYKKGKRTRVDIDSYTGDVFTAEELSALKELKKELEAAEKSSQTQNPFKNQGRVAKTDSVAENVRKFVEDITKSLGIDKQIIIITDGDFNEGQYQKHGLYGTLAQVRSAKLSNANPYEYGSKRYMADADAYYIYYDGKLKGDQLFTVVSHEIGHIVEQEVFNNSSEQTKKAVKEDYEKWLASLTGKTVEEVARETRDITLADLIEGNTRKFDPSKDRYISSFSEYFADNVAKWARTSEKPKNAVDKYFSGIVEAFKKLHDYVFEKGLYSKSLFEWLDGMYETKPSAPSLASQVEEMRTLPPAKRKAMQESLEAQYGKEEVAKMIEITANFTKIIDDLEEKGIVKKDCP